MKILLLIIQYLHIQQTDSKLSRKEIKVMVIFTHRMIKENVNENEVMKVRPTKTKVLNNENHSKSSYVT